MFTQPTLRSFVGRAVACVGVTIAIGGHILAASAASAASVSRTPPAALAPVDAVDYLLHQPQGSTLQLARLEQALFAAFDAAGSSMGWTAEIDNWTPLRWRCAVAAATGEMHECVWLFAGSSETLGVTGQWAVRAHVARCRLPCSGHVTHMLAEFEAAQAHGDVLAVRLPGQSGLTLASALEACLAAARVAPIDP